MKCPRCKGTNTKLIRKHSDTEEYDCLDCLKNSMLGNAMAGYFMYFTDNNTWGVPNSVIEIYDKDGVKLKTI